MHLYKRVCPSVCQSVRRSVRLSVTRFFRTWKISQKWIKSHLFISNSKTVWRDLHWIQKQISSGRGSSVVKFGVTDGRLGVQFQGAVFLLFQTWIQHARLRKNKKIKAFNNLSHTCKQFQIIAKKKAGRQPSHGSSFIFYFLHFLHKRFIHFFRCVLASLYEGVSVGLSVRRSCFFSNANNGRFSSWKSPGRSTYDIAECA